MARPAPPRDPRLPDHPFRTRDAATLGVGRAHLRTTAFDAPFAGVRVAAGGAATVRERCRALLPLLDDGVVFSHSTALRLLDVEVPWMFAEDDRIHVVTRRQEDRVLRPGVVAHRTRQTFLEVAQLGELPVTTAAQTFVHVGCELRTPDDVVVLGDAVLRRDRDLTTIAELTDVAARTHKVKGIAQVREQLVRVRAGTDSSMETRTRLALVAGGLPCPLVNQVVRDPSGAYVKRVDLVYPRLRIAIEYDGDQHRTDQAQWREDVRARRRLEELGWTVIVVVAPDITGDPRALIARVRTAIARARTRP
jgi:hypothetical protein